jgi:alginate O-acetyltransferase complex protein AlgI
LFGLKVPENFSWPYLKTSITDFWRSWHMSLTSWITDYVYKPLGGSRRGLALTVLNVMIAMAVSGLWHGAAWHFLAWGVFHGTLLAGYRVWRAAFGEAAASRGGWIGGAVGATLGTALTFALVTLGWGLFAMPVDRFMLMLGRLL